MTRRILLLLAVLCGFSLTSRADSTEPGPKPKLTPKYRLEAEIRKEGAPRTVVIDTLHEAPAKHLYYTTADHMRLAMVHAEAPAAAKEVARPKWVRRFDLPVRSFDAKEIDEDTPKVVVEVFRDDSTGLLVYASETGGLAVVEPRPHAGFKVAAPKHLYRLQLKIRPSGETDFIRNYIKLNVEVYLHEPTGHLIYVGHNGTLAVVATEKNFRELKPKPAVWSHAMDLRARKPDQNEFDRETPRIGMEIYADENAETLVYGTELLTLAVAPAAKKVPEKILPPLWKHQLQSGKFVAEVYSNPNAGHTVVIAPTGAIAVVPEKPEPPALPRENAPGVSVAGVGVLAPTGKVLFLPGETGTEAVAIFNGKLLWSAEGTGEPLLASAEHVFSQVQVKGKANQVKLAILDATTGEKVRESDAIEFPDWVSVPVEYGHGFRSAARLDKDGVLFVWDAHTFQDGGRPPPDRDPNAKKASGAFRIDVKTGRVSAVKDYKPKDEELNGTLGTKTRVGGWAFWVESGQSSGAGARTTVSRVLKAERLEGKGEWKRPIAGVVHLLPRP